MHSDGGSLTISNWRYNREPLIVRYEGSPGSNTKKSFLLMPEIRICDSCPTIKKIEKISKLTLHALFSSCARSHIGSQLEWSIKQRGHRYVFRLIDQHYLYQFQRILLQVLDGASQKVTSRGPRARNTQVWGWWVGITPLLFPCRRGRHSKIDFG